MDDDDETGAFQPQMIKAAIQKSCEHIFGNQSFKHDKFAAWTTTHIENVLKEIAVANGEAAKTPGKTKFKFVVHAQLQQRTGSGMVSASARYGEKALDDQVCHKWENEEVQVLTTVFAVAI